MFFLARANTITSLITGDMGGIVGQTAGMSMSAAVGNTIDFFRGLGGGH